MKQPLKMVKQLSSVRQKESLPLKLLGKELLTE